MNKQIIHIVNMDLQKTYIELKMLTFEKNYFISNSIYTFSNPILIQCDYIAEILIQNCTFSNGFVDSSISNISPSTAGLSIYSIQSIISIHNTSFYDNISKGQYNSMKIIGKSLIIADSNFYNSSYLIDNSLWSGIYTESGFINADIVDISIENCNF